MSDDSLPVIWSPAAESDLLDLWTQAATVASPDIADSHLRDINRATAMVAMWPFAGKARDELLSGIRSVPVYPHVIFYRPLPARIQIVRIIDGRRDIEAALGE